MSYHGNFHYFLAEYTKSSNWRELYQVVQNFDFYNDGWDNPLEQQDVISDLTRCMSLAAQAEQWKLCSELINLKAVCAMYGNISINSHMCERAACDYFIDKDQIELIIKIVESETGLCYIPVLIKKAAEQGKLELIKVLFKKAVDSSKGKEASLAFNLESAFVCAVERKHWATVQFFIQQDNFPKGSRIQEPILSTTLAGLAYSEYWEECNKLIELCNATKINNCYAKSDVHIMAKSAEGWLVAHNAMLQFCLHEQHELISKTLQNYNLSTLINGKTLLQYLCEKELTLTLKHIVQTHQPTPGDPENFGVALLYYAKQKNKELCAYLVKNQLVAVDWCNFNSDERQFYAIDYFKAYGWQDLISTVRAIMASRHGVQPSTHADNHVEKTAEPAREQASEPFTAPLYLRIAPSSQLPLQDVKAPKLYLVLLSLIDVVSPYYMRKYKSDKLETLRELLVALQESDTEISYEKQVGDFFVYTLEFIDCIRDSYFITLKSIFTAHRALLFLNNIFRATLHKLHPHSYKDIDQCSTTWIHKNKRRIESEVVPNFVGSDKKSSHLHIFPLQKPETNKKYYTLINILLYIEKQKLLITDKIKFTRLKEALITQQLFSSDIPQKKQEMYIIEKSFVLLDCINGSIHNTLSSYLYNSYLVTLIDTIFEPILRAQAPNNDKAFSHCRCFWLSVNKEKIIQQARSQLLGSTSASTSLQQVPSAPSSELRNVKKHWILIDLISVTPRVVIQEKQRARLQEIREELIGRQASKEAVTYRQQANEIIEYMLAIISCLKKSSRELQHIYVKHSATLILNSLFRSSLKDPSIYTGFNSAFFEVELSSLQGQKNKILAIAQNASLEEQERRSRVLQYTDFIAGEESCDLASYTLFPLSMRQHFDASKLLMLLNHSRCGVNCPKNKAYFNNASACLIVNQSLQFASLTSTISRLKRSPVATIPVELKLHFNGLHLFADKSNSLLRMQNYILYLEAIVKRLSVNGGSILGDYRPNANHDTSLFPGFINPEGKQMLFLWHGTSPSNVQNISESNFLLSKSKHQLYGPGTYYTPQVCKALQYTDNDNPCLLLSAVFIERAYYPKGAGGIPPAQSEHYDTVIAVPAYSNSGKQTHWEFVVTKETSVVPILKVNLSNNRIAQNNVAAEMCFVQ
jgi:hypothetical protein